MKLAMIAAVVALAACTGAQGYVPASLTSADQMVMDKAFRQNFADPGSAQTRAVQVFQSQGGARMICGSVNAKNAFGGFVGFQTFTVVAIPGADYSKPYVNPIFATGLVANADCGGAGYVPV